MAVNRELIKNTMELIKATPEVHHQANWVNTSAASPCGTVMCFAGHAAVLAGAEIPDPKKHQISDWYVGTNGEYRNWTQAYEMKASENTPVATFAKDAMGVSHREADYMFEPERQVSELELAVAELVEHGQILTFNEHYDDDYDDYDDTEDDDCHDYCCDYCN